MFPVVHHNFCVIPKPEDLDVSTLTADEKTMVERSDKFMASGRAYAQEQATRPSTLGFVLSSSPLALLAWVGASRFRSTLRRTG